MTNYPKRGEVFWVHLDPTLGSEIQKTRPAVIISNDIGNELSTCIVVAPITSNVGKIYPIQVKVSIKGKLGKVITNQLRTVDKRRLGKKIGSLDEESMLLVDSTIKLVLGLV